MRKSNPCKGKLSAPVQTSPKAHPASYIMGTGLFPEVRCLENGVSHPSPTNSEIKETVPLYLYSSVPSWYVTRFYFDASGTNW